MGTGPDDVLIAQSTSDVATAPLFTVGVNGAGQVTGKVHDASGTIRAAWTGFETCRAGDLIHLQVAWDAGAAIDGDYHLKVIVNERALPRTAFSTKPTVPWTSFVPTYLSTGKYCDTGFDGTFLFVQVGSVVEPSQSTGAASFDPSQVPAVRAWYRLSASTPVAGEWETVVDALGGPSLIQTDSDRKLAVGTSGNGFPIGVYDGSDVWRMPLSASNFSTSKFGVAWWLSVSSTHVVQYAFVIFNNDAVSRVLTFRFNTDGTLGLAIYIGTNTDGRVFNTATPVPDGTFQFLRFQFDSTKTNECDTNGVTADAKVRVFINETAQPLIASDFGAGGTLTTLRTPSGAGAAVFGGLNDADTPSSPIVNGSKHGPNTYVLLDSPTAAQAVSLMNFCAPS